MNIKRLLLIFLLFFIIFPAKGLAISSSYNDLIYNVVGEDIEEEKVNIYFFYGDGCPHCAREEKFLDSLMNKYNDKINIYFYETWNNADNKNLMLSIKKLMEKNPDYGVPFTVIGDNAYSGYSDATGRKMEANLKEYLEIEDEEGSIVDESKEDIPLLGEVDVRETSILLITIILGFIDGFNPCAMWALLFLINMLFNMKDKKKMLLLGITFLLISGLVYFVSMLGISEIFTFISVPIIRFLIGIVAIVAGIFSFRKYLIARKEEAGCHVVDAKKRKKIFERIRKFTTEKNLFLALVGVSMLAISVNLVELACSTVFPATFASILSINNVTGFLRIVYLLIYTFFYMIDDIVVFVISVCTLNIVTASSKYGKYSSLVGAIIMILIGILLIFKPGWLMFNF